MKAGDLVRIRDSSILALVMRIDFRANFYKSIAEPTKWVILLGQPVPYKASKLEVISDS